MRIASLAAAVLILASCATGVPVERQVVVPGGNFEAVQGEARLTVRAFLPPVGNERQEVLGATCSVASSLYSAELVTPSRLVVPNFGPQSPELAIQCRSGEFSGSARARIVTRWQQAPGYWGNPWGPWGWGPGWGGYGYGGPGIPISDYPDVGVILQ